MTRQPDAQIRTSLIRGGAAAGMHMLVEPLEHCDNRMDGSSRCLKLSPADGSSPQSVATDAFRSSRTRGFGFGGVHPAATGAPDAADLSLLPGPPRICSGNDARRARRMPERGKTGISTVNGDLLRPPGRH